MSARHPAWLVVLNQDVADLPRSHVLPIERALSRPQHDLYLALATFLGRIDPDAPLDRGALVDALVLLKRPLGETAVVGQALARALKEGEAEARRLAVGHLERELAMAGVHHGALPFLEASIVRARRRELKRYGVMANRFANEVSTDVRRQLVTGVLRRESFHVMTKRVAGTLYHQLRGPVASDAQMLSLSLYRRARQRAERIVRTEVISAYNAAATLGLQELARTNPQIRKKWLAALDYRTCTLCRSLDGTVVGVDDAFPGGVTTLAHPYCFAPETVVQGRYVAALKAAYSGELVHVATAAGRGLSVTQNHPIMTRRGMVAAHELRKGDDLVGYSGDSGVGSSLRQSDKEHQPSRIGEVFSALRDRGSFGRSVAAASDLHGDAVGVQGDIDVVWANRSLLSDRDASTAKLIGDRVFVVPDMALRDGDPLCPQHEGRHRTSRAADGEPSASKLPRDSGRVSFDDRPLETLCVGSASQMDATVLEGDADRITREAKFLGDLFHRFAGLVAFDPVVEVRNTEFRGHVMDLQSPYGWTIANGLLASNCRCVIVMTEEEKT